MMVFSLRGLELWQEGSEKSDEQRIFIFGKAVIQTYLRCNVLKIAALLALHLPNEGLWRQVTESPWLYNARPVYRGECRSGNWLAQHSDLRSSLLTNLSISQIVSQATGRRSPMTLTSWKSFLVSCMRAVASKCLPCSHRQVSQTIRRLLCRARFRDGRLPLWFRSDGIHRCLSIRRLLVKPKNSTTTCNESPTRFWSAKYI